MRPSDAFGRARPADNDSPATFPNSASPQMTYFLADEAAVDNYLEQPIPNAQRPWDARKHQPGKSDSSTVAAPAENAEKPGLPTDRVAETETVALDDESRPITPPNKPLGTPASHPLPPTSQPMTPIFLGTSGPASALSSSSSRRNSFEGSLSEGVGSSALSVAGGVHLEHSSDMMDSGSAPQLIMPSIRMPSRRPFTEEGKRIGRLKVLVAGDSGAGKTSLIKAIVQSCEHIVHVDPIGSISKARARPGRLDNTTSQISEIYASTKPYPEWWTDLDDIRVLRRRKSLGDSVLDRNICFVDTPGYTSASSAMEIITHVVQYLSTYLDYFSSNSLGEADLLNLLGGDGGCHVHAVFYCISNQLKPADAEYLRLLSPLTNVIPLVVKADTMSPEQLERSKERISSQLHEANIRPFTFDLSDAKDAAASAPYAVSCAPGSDHENMDASLLMSPDYVQPLIPTELGRLISRVFCQDGASWLRHSAARKFLQWRRSNGPSRPQALYRPLSSPAAVGHVLGSRDMMIRAGGPASTLAMARVVDHTQQEERLAHIRLANWASELQRSLANERARYDELAKSERAVWLTERLSECVQGGTLVPLPGRGRDDSRAEQHLRQTLGRRRRASSKSLQHQDPLGLLEVAARLRAQGWLALEAFGGLSVLGGLTYWVTKQGWHLLACEWLGEDWGKFWYGER